MEVILPIAAFVAIAVLARMNTPVSGILRAFWNLSFTFCSLIPFCGWAANFIIADEKTKKAKDELARDGARRDADAWGDVARSAQNSVDADAARRTQAAAQRHQTEEDLRTRSYQANGTRDVHVNSDGTRARYGQNSDWENVNEFKEKM